MDPNTASWTNTEGVVGVGIPSLLVELELAAGGEGQGEDSDLSLNMNLIATSVSEDFRRPRRTIELPPMPIVSSERAYLLRNSGSSF